MSIKPLGIPVERDDNHILMFEEFCGLTSIPPRTVSERASEARPAVVALRREGVAPADRRRAASFLKTGE